MNLMGVIVVMLVVVMVGYLLSQSFPDIFLHGSTCLFSHSCELVFFVPFI